MIGLKENYSDTAGEGYTTARWYEIQITEALRILGADRTSVASYYSFCVTDEASPKILAFTLRNGLSYWFLNFVGLAQVAEVMTPEQKMEQETLLRLFF